MARANHILKINLDTYETKKIGEGQIPKDYQYCGCIIHYNKMIYFFPQKDAQVMVLNPETEEIKFIGDKINSYCYGAAIADNGCIYGYTSYLKGILKINPYTECVNVLCEKIVETGFYGTKLGKNGKMYSVPGDSNKIYEFDPKTEKVKLKRVNLQF